MKTISIEKPDRIITYNPMFVKRVELVRKNEMWCVNVVHTVNDRETVETVLVHDFATAKELHSQYKSCLESI